MASYKCVNGKLFLTSQQQTKTLYKIDDYFHEVMICDRKGFMNGQILIRHLKFLVANDT